MAYNKYIILESTDRIDHRKRCLLISREVKKLFKPLDDSTDVCKGAFEVISKGEKSAIVYDENFLIHVHPDHDVSYLILLIGEATKEEIAQLEGALNKYPVIPFKALIPSTSEVRDEKWMKENKWIEEI